MRRLCSRGPTRASGVRTSRVRLFFFSSRRRHTRLQGDWSSDVCSSDLHVPGALLWTGDSHAAQGNGEVNLTALETAYKEFNITVEVIKGRALDFPRIETERSWITIGLDQDLNKAWDQAKAETEKFLAGQRNIAAA